jgi:spermidine/putrescine transport system ATP-binding protein
MLKIRSIAKSYEGQPLLKDVSFNIDTGETICLLGASGSGKSTLLRIIAGLEQPESGLVLWDGADLAPTPPHARDFGLVFQDYALFPHLTVFDNVAFGLRMRNQPKGEIQNRVTESLETVNLRGFEFRRVTDLSGGEQQRVALARALATRPRLLMFDEPLGALDRSLKEDLLNELRAILHHTDIPAIYVTHDQEEAFVIADRILLLHEGMIIREGTPAQVWNDPQSAWVARFLNVGNVVIGKMKDKSGKMKVHTDFGVFEVECKHQHAEGDEVALLLKPSAGGTRIQARVEDVLFNREQFKVTLRGGLVVQLDEAPEVGSEISVRFRAECLGYA